MALVPAGSYHLKITLVDTRPSVWRRVVVPGNIALHSLHLVIQHAMGWREMHLHAFLINGTGYSTRHEPGDLEELQMLEDRTMSLRALVTDKGATFRYDYDFGDDWEHELVVEKVLSKNVLKASCIAGANACPPEDVGGVPGYERLVRAMARYGSRDYLVYRDWYGRFYDARAFNTEAADLRVGSLRLKLLP